MSFISHSRPNVQHHELSDNEKFRDNFHNVKFFHGADIDQQLGDDFFV